MIVRLPVELTETAKNLPDNKLTIAWWLTYYQDDFLTYYRSPFSKTFLKWSVFYIEIGSDLWHQIDFDFSILLAA